MCVISTVESTMETFIIPAMRLFLKKGYDVTLICNMSDDFFVKYSNEFHCINIPMKRGISIYDMIVMPFKFYKIFKRNKFDYVQYATTNASWNAAFSALLAKVPVRVYCQWGFLYISYTGFKRWAFKMVEKLLCSLSTHITCPSRKNMQYAIDEKLCNSQKCSMIGDGGTIGVDLSVFDYNKREKFKKEVLLEYPQFKGKTVFGYLGRIEIDKGINELLKAFLLLKNPNAFLFLMGDFDTLRSGLDKKLLEKAQSSSNIIFHGFTNEVPKYLSVVDILVHPTYREGFSMAIQQAMAMGCAIITTNVPGPSEVIEEGSSGVLVPDHDYKDLSEAMNNLLNNKNLQKSFAESGLLRVRKKFERKRMLEMTVLNREQMMREKNIKIV